MKPSGIGGQAVIEGVMMKNKDEYAVAVRKPNNEIVIEKNTYVSFAEKVKLFKLPIFRGMLAFVESMLIGTKTLTFSASFYEEEEETKPSKVDTAFSKVFKEKAEAVAMGLTLLLSLALAIGIFMLLPLFAANLLTKHIESDIVLTLIECFIRIFIFIAYIVAISQIKDIKRMFMYHGAEHKTINCLEQGYELTVENVRWQSKQHKRCGTSFMFFVMFISIIFFIFIKVDTIWLRALTRVLLVPIIAGVSYEFIRLAGRSNSLIVNILSAPGMWLQGLTTKEPEDEMIEVAIQSVEAVFNWREFLNNDTTKKRGDEIKSSTQADISTDEALYSEDSFDTEINNNKKGTNSNNKNKSNNRNNSKNSNNRSRSQTSQNKADEINLVSEETAVTKEKVVGPTPTAIFGEEDDEILRALDRYLIDENESNNKD
ncbi:MAG: hypothetical protein K0S41_361 [Anaerocolumna sp.]|jgi:uncharacterized protein YqhQ|nr:hypothetical protein [Anaerocolumna sp.]